MAMSRVLLVSAALLLTGVLAACTPAGAGEDRALPSSASAAPTARPAPTPIVSVPVTSATLAPPAPDVPAPERLSIPSLEVDMSITPVGVQDDGSMEIPKNPARAGWYRYGAAPADETGTTVIAAHVDSRIFGIGPLAKLRDAKEGETLAIRDAAGDTHRYEIESVTYIPRAELPVDQVFDRDGDARLAVITCGGSFDEQTRTYSDNVVLIARALP